MKSATLNALAVLILIVGIVGSACCILFLNIPIAIALVVITFISFCILLALAQIIKYLGTIANQAYNEQPKITKFIDSTAPQGWVCGKCGTRNPDGSKVCSNCSK